MPLRVLALRVQEPAGLVCKHVPVNEAALQELLDKQAVHECVLRYCRGIDRMDAELVRSCYHADATDEHGAFLGTRDVFVDWVMDAIAQFTVTMHVVANHLC